MYRFCIIFSLIILSGCTVKAVRDGDTMVLRGWGAKKAVWENGVSIEKEEPISVPDIMPVR